MQQHSDTYIIGFAAAVCLVCSILVSASAVLLKDRQERNRVLDRHKQVLAVAGLLEDGESVSPATVEQRFAEHIRTRVVDLETGRYDDAIDPATFDQQRAAKDPQRSRPAPPNPAGVLRLPRHALVYQRMDGDEVGLLILPVEGKGLWSTLYGYLALAPDTTTIRGITFYQHGETPGLGGEIDNPGWKAGWDGRRAYDERGEPVISVAKGPAGPPQDDPYRVDGLSGATLTGRGVSNLVQLWLSEDGFKPYLERVRATRGEP